MLRTKDNMNYACNWINNNIGTDLHKIILKYVKNYSADKDVDKALKSLESGTDFYKEYWFDYLLILNTKEYTFKGGLIAKNILSFFLFENDNHEGLKEQLSPMTEETKKHLREIGIKSYAKQFDIPIDVATKVWDLKLGLQIYTNELKKLGQKYNKDFLTLT